MTLTAPSTPTAEALRARTAVVVAFAVNGLAFATFVSRTPAVRDGLGLGSGQMGLLLLCLSAGAISGLPASGPVVHRIGPGRTVLAGAVSAAVGLVAVGAGVTFGAVAPVAIGLYLTGLGSGIWDVAMNVEGADVERALGRPLMPRLHAAFSLGTVAGAGIGAVAAAAGLSLAAQVVVVAVVLPFVLGVVHRRFLARAPHAEKGERSSGVLQAWCEPRTLAIGLVVLGFAFTEGSANDWIAFAFVDGYGGSDTLGAVAFGCFVTAMTLGRLVGGSALERLGRVRALRMTALVAVGGLVLVILGGSPPVALAGAVLWGLGACLGFPVGMSAAADDPRRAPARVSVVSSIGYTAFLAGPPLIGLLAEHVGLLRGLFVVLAALSLATLAVGATRPLPDRPRR